MGCVVASYLCIVGWIDFIGLYGRALLKETTRRSCASHTNDALGPDQ